MIQRQLSCEIDQWFFVKTKQKATSGARSTKFVFGTALCQGTYQHFWKSPITAVPIDHVVPITPWAIYATMVYCFDKRREGKFISIIQGLRSVTPSATLAKGRKQLNVKGAERRGPRFGATNDLILPRATCAELVALCCAVCLLEMPRSDRQDTGAICEESEPREDNHVKKEKRRVRTYIPVPTSHDTWYCCMFERKHSEARHSTAQRCAALLSFGLAKPSRECLFGDSTM